MNKKRITIFTVGAAFILMLGLFISYLSTVISISHAPPIILPSAPLTSSGDVPTGDHTAQTNDSGSYVQAEITRDNVQSIVSSLSRAEGYFAQISVFLYWPDGQSLTYRRVYTKQPYTCVVTLDETGNEVDTKITGGGHYFSWLSGSDHFYQGAAGQTTADDLDNIPTYENLTSLDPDQILSAGYEDYDNNHCILATAYLPEYDYTDKYWISLDSGLLIYFERYKDESLTMRIDMTQYLQETPDDAVFTLPNTQLAWDVQ